MTSQPRFRHTALALLVGAALLAGCSDKQAPAQAMGPLPVTTLEMQPQSVPSSIEVMAQTEGARETEVRARVGGILVKRFYQEGDTVKAGQPLFQIDRAPYEIALAEAKARAEQTEREMNRLHKLADAKAISQKDYDDARSNNAMAQAALRQAELNLSWTTVTAPVSGVSARAVRSEGNLIGTANDNSLLTSIYQTNPMWVRFSLGESDLAKLPGGRVTEKQISGVELVLPNGQIYDQPGKLNFVASNIDTTLGTQALRAEFANPTQQLLPGQFVRVRLLTGMRDGVFLVPQSAVLQTEQGTLLMTATPDNKVAPRPVQAGEWRGKDWVILGGLQAGDRVIVDNLMKLKPGAPIAPHAPGQPPAGAPAQGGAPAAKAEAPKADTAATDKPAAQDSAAPAKKD
ncbi:efflux RND transporter periplasmic adaptor subunit [Azonexus sp. R2A61]|uniref:efflux RND transporter periplasmic adaptor subunit n=1 Tax=Azonexus sp. R2A61 TaxID=2744443 RepID=UPI001F398DFB|nr:efflux RND transporter periplasmic adaptor subunit [Azonexus sp. R2A61]